MDIDARISEIKAQESQNSAIYKISATAGSLLYASLFLAAFERHRLLALCVTFLLVLCLRVLWRLHTIRVEGRILQETKQNMV
jgi:hypothetical protein